MKEEFTLDDRHEVFNRFASDCGNCKHYKDDYSCPAFPNGNIPDDLLAGFELHDAVLENQTGKTVFETNNGKHWWSQKRKEWVIEQKERITRKKQGYGSETNCD